MNTFYFCMCFLYKRRIVLFYKILHSGILFVIKMCVHIQVTLIQVIPPLQYERIKDWCVGGCVWREPEVGKTGVEGENVHVKEKRRFFYLHVFYS